jgi:hypothetical protein
MDMEPDVAHDEVPVEDAARIPVGEGPVQGTTKSGRGAPPEEREPKPGRKASQKPAETDPEQKWVPKGFGRSSQRDDPPCSDGMAQDKFLWTPQTIGRRPQRGDPQCSSSTAQGKIHQERSDQDSDGTRNPETTKGRGETMEKPGMQNGNKGPYHERHSRVGMRTAIAPRKRMNAQECPR